MYKNLYNRKRKKSIINIINILKKYNWIKIIFMVSIHSSLKILLYKIYILKYKLYNLIFLIF